jgi:hypothetical protein
LLVSEPDETAMHAPFLPPASPSFATPSFASLGAIALKNMDRSRQARGKLLDRAGYGPDIGVNLQHVGVLVGASAHARIWPAIFRWLDENRR